MTRAERVLLSRISDSDLLSDVRRPLGASAVIHTLVAISSFTATIIINRKPLRIKIGISGLGP